MIPNVNAGDTLFHKYLGVMKVTNVNGKGVRCDTGARGILDFNFYDFGKVLFFHNSHSQKYFETYDAYSEFYENEKRNMKIQIEKERYALKQIEEKHRKEVEKQQDLERKERQLQREEKKTIINQNTRCVNNKSKKDFDELKLKVKELKEKQKFQGLWHFTDFTNLQSIFDTGELSSRKKCIDNNYQFLDGANHDVVDRANEFVHSCTRFYYRPKTPTLYDNEGIKPIKYSNKVHVPRPVYLLFSEELIYDKDTMFSNGNATNSPLGDNIEFFNGMDWDSIFHNTWFQPEARDYIINKRHAELLSKNPVNLKSLLNIIFRSEADLNQAIRLWGKNNKFIVNENCFSDKSNLSITDWRYNNYIKNYSINYSNKKLVLIICLKKPLQDYSISWSIEDSKGSSKTEVVKKILDIKFTNQSNYEISELKDTIEVKFTFNFKPSVGDIIKIYLNNILCIEETIIK